MTVHDSLNKERKNSWILDINQEGGEKGKPKITNKDNGKAKKKEPKCDLLTN